MQSQSRRSLAQSRLRLNADADALTSRRHRTSPSLSCLRIDISIYVVSAWQSCRRRCCCCRCCRSRRLIKQPREIATLIKIIEISHGKRAAVASVALARRASTHAHTQGHTHTPTHLSPISVAVALCAANCKLISMQQAMQRRAATWTCPTIELTAPTRCLAHLMDINMDHSVGGGNSGTTPGIL